MRTGSLPWFCLAALLGLAGPANLPLLHAQSLSREIPSPQERQQRENTVPTEAAPPAPIAPPRGDAWDQWVDGNAFLGNWGGARDTLEKKGVTFFGSYEADVAYNPVGGKDQGSAYADNFDFGFRFNMEKLTGWKGAQIVVSGINRDDRNLSADKIGNYYPVQQVFGRNTLLLYALYLDQTFMDDKLAFKIGRFSLSDDFATSPIYGLYMNNGFDGNSKSLDVSQAFPVYPASVWGTRVRYSPNRDFTFKAGIVQANTREYEEHTANRFGLVGPNDGVTFVGEADWNPVFFGPRPTPAELNDVAQASEPSERKGLEGHYWFLTYYSTLRTSIDANITSSGSPVAAQVGDTQTYGFYWHGDQRIYQPQPGSEKGLTIWADFVLQPQENAQLIPYQIDGGLFYRGLIPTRDDDSLIFGALDGIFSSNSAVTTLDLGTPGRAGSEQVFEFAYRIETTKFTYAEPDVQWIVHPSGSDAIANALVLGLRIGVTF